MCLKTRRDQKEGGEADSHEEVRRFCGSRRDQEEGVSWTLTKRLDAFAGTGKIKSREAMLDPQVSPEEIKSREVEPSLRGGLLSLQLFPNGGTTNIVTLLGQQLRGAVVAAQCRTDTALTFCCSGGGPRQPWSSGLAPVSRSHSSIPLSHSSPSLTGLLASVDVKQQSLSLSLSL